MGYGVVIDGIVLLQAILEQSYLHRVHGTLLRVVLGFLYALLIALYHPRPGDEEDGDGARDLAVGAVNDDDGGSNRGALWVLFLQCNPCDMNCDGRVNVFDIEPFLELLFNGAAPCGTCAGDANGDGSIDAFDIEPFLDCLFR